MSWLSVWTFLALSVGTPTEVRVVTLGDSITRGVRRGVKAEDTFQVLLEKSLTEKKKLRVRIINAGIGGERTDQALARLPRVLQTHRPAVVTIMYGHNDSHIDRGKTTPRLPLEQYEANLRRLIAELRKAKVQPVLMTPPCYSRKARQGGVAENPNVQLFRCATVVRRLARELKVPVIDHYAHWHQQLDRGDDVEAWTTDLYHPNPRGHRELARQILPVLLEILSVQR